MDVSLRQQRERGDRRKDLATAPNNRAVVAPRRLSLSAAQDGEGVQRLLSQHLRHLFSSQRLAVQLDDLVAHLEVGPARRRVWLDLGDYIAVVEVAPHLLEQVGPSIGARRAHEIASVWGCGRALKLPAFCSARFIRTCTVSFCAPYGLPEMAGLAAGADLAGAAFFGCHAAR